MIQGIRAIAKRGGKSASGNCPTSELGGAYAGSTIYQAHIALGNIFKSTRENGFVDKHPMDGVRFDSPLKVPDAIRFLTVAKQKAFLTAAERSRNDYQYALILIKKNRRRFQR